MDPALAQAILARARALFDASADLEVTLEANPTDAEAARFSAFAAAGVNRLSLGVQSLDDASLAFLGRNHGAATARRAAKTAAQHFSRLSIDLIYALPGQTTADWRRDLEQALTLAPEHVSAYQLTIEAGTAFHRAASRGRWTPATPDAAAGLFETTQMVLEGAGYGAYEVSNHARGEAARSRHNLIYWRGGDYLGVGPGAHGRLTDSGGIRWATRAPDGIADYIAAARQGADPPGLEQLLPAAAALERLLMGLRTVEGVSLAELAPLGMDQAKIAALAEQGFLTRREGRIIASPAGRALLDRITLELAANAA